ncbi:MAG: cytochrome C [Proteobacteria bacterium]|nr:cytochrome C [Pseudomonadota bacterium]
MAVPSFARQTQQPCSACHVGGFGPELTAFGRRFKLLGYTMKVGSQTNLPLSAMLVESFTHTLKAQTSAPATGFDANNNVELQQASVFLAGRLTNNLGVLAQATYSQNGGLLGWDNADVRYASTFTHGDHTGIWGISLNNNPTVSDVFNSAPAWSYPYMAADLAPGAPAQPILVGGLGGQVVGATGYAQLDGKWYLEAGAYRSLSVAFTNHVNAGYDGRVVGAAPYVRMNHTWNLPAGVFELGGFGMAVRRGLVGADLAGNPIPLAGPADRFRDLGVDANYQFFHGDHAVTVDGLYVTERQTLNATYATGGSSNLHDSLQSLNLKGSYWYLNTYGVTLAAFADNGSSDRTLYGNDGSPNTQGGIVELDYNPFGQSTSWLQPWVNLRLGLQYTFYSRFSGLVHNVDGAGRSASDNNTLYLFLWTSI